MRDGEGGSSWHSPELGQQAVLAHCWRFITVGFPVVLLGTISMFGRAGTAGTWSTLVVPGINGDSGLLFSS